MTMTQSIVTAYGSSSPLTFRKHGKGATKLKAQGPKVKAEREKPDDELNDSNHLNPHMT
jgi:hypothetical protein